MAYWSGPLTILGLTYPNYAKQSLLTPNNLTPSLTLSGNGLPVAAAQYDSSGNLVIPDNAVIRGADYNWKNQQVDQQTLNVERQIRPGMVVDVGYLGVRGHNNNFSKNINQAPPTAPGVDYNTQRPVSPARRYSNLKLYCQQLVRCADSTVRRGHYAGRDDQRELCAWTELSEWQQSQSE
jgi:hypothetical protein